MSCSFHKLNRNIGLRRITLSYFFPSFCKSSVFVHVKIVRSLDLTIEYCTHARVSFCKPMFPKTLGLWFCHFFPWTNHKILTKSTNVTAELPINDYISLFSCMFIFSLCFIFHCMIYTKEFPVICSRIFFFFSKEVF